MGAPACFANSMTGDEIYKRVYPKAQFERVLSEGQQAHGQVIQGHQDLDDEINRIAQSMGEAWDSEGAKAAKAEMQKIRAMSATVAGGLPKTQTSYGDEMSAHQNCRNSLQACGAEPAKASWWGRQSWLPGGTTQEELDGQHDEQERHNIQQYNQFTGHSETNEGAIYQDYPSAHISTAVASSHNKPDGVDPSNSPTPTTHSPSQTSTSSTTSPSNAGAGTTAAPSVNAAHGSSSAGAGSSSSPSSSGSYSGNVHVGTPSRSGAGGASSSGSVGRSRPPVAPNVGTAPAASGSPSTTGKWTGDGYKPVDVGGGSTSAAGYSDPGLAASSGIGDVGGFGGMSGGTSSGYGSQSGGGAGGNAGALAGGMMPPPMMGGGMGAGGEQIRSGGGFGSGLGAGEGEGAPGAGGRSGVGNFGPEGSGGSSTSSPTTSARGAMGGGPMGAGRGGKKGEDEEHEDKYTMDVQMEDGISQKDERGEFLVDPVTGMMVPPTVIGE